MTRKIRNYLSLLLLCCLINITACGNENMEQSSGSAESSERLTVQDILTPGNTMDTDKMNQYLGVDVSALETSVEDLENVPENVILVAAMATDYTKISDVITGYNQSQSEYKVEVKRYESEDAMLLDLVRGKGCDVLVLNPSKLKILGNKDALEDLNPYIENSELIDLDDMFPAVRECGTINNKFLGILPSFYVTALLVEKGYTDNGGWTIDDYLALMDLHPEVPISACVNVKEYNSWFLNELVRVPEMFVDWENRTCSFDSPEFIELIKQIREYALRFPERTQVSPIIPRASYLYDKEVQVLVIHMLAGKVFEDYKCLRDTFFEDYELVGVPNESGLAEYQLTLINIIYGMNANSKKKEVAWSFLEYILSEEYQETIMGNSGSYFAARRDVVDRKLQEEIAASKVSNEDKIYRRYYNIYLDENVPDSALTEKDREHLLYILEHLSGETSMMLSRETGKIFGEEMKAFAAGDKTAEETAKNLQNRMSLLLME